MQIHYYLLCFRVEALVASHLSPEEFGLYMAVGTRKLSAGKVIFFEIDFDAAPAAAPEPAEDYFHLRSIRERVVPHEDGSPKRSRYVSVYRVMEHVPLGAFGDLYLTTRDGRVLRLQGEAYSDENEGIGPNLYLELCPLIPLVASRLPPGAFMHRMTDPAEPIHVPRLLVADLLLNLDTDGHIARDLPYQNPAHLEECIRELGRGAGKDSKTVSRSPYTPALYRTLRRGLFLGDQTGTRVYRFPDRHTLEIFHGPWWRSASLQ